MAPDTPAGHLDRIVSMLSDAGFTPYWREHWVTDGLAVVNVLIPGLERFMLITDGILVLPGERGLRVRREGISASGQTSRRARATKTAPERSLRPVR